MVFYGNTRADYDVLQSILMHFVLCNAFLHITYTIIIYNIITYSRNLYASVLKFNLTRYTLLVKREDIARLWTDIGSLFSLFSFPHFYFHKMLEAICITKAFDLL